MKLAGLAIVLSLVVAFDAVAFDAPAASDADDEREVRNADMLFWDAYNACDMRRIGELVTADIEFYHDKTGLTTSRAAVVDSLRNGPCADPTSRLRRALIDESLAFHPLKDGYAILSGRHRFYAQQRDQPERLDGQADFTTVWKLDDGHWRMHRVLSYAHAPVAYVPPSVTVMLPAATLARYAGRYHSKRAGNIVVSIDGNHLKLVAGSFVATLYPESTTRFFAIERDIRFDFETDDNGHPVALSVYENGVVSERALREK
ncbi:MULTISPECIES: DUF4440 domain-containing protein [Xanthomonas]|uniref:nuclear transport factor 2 family protein n=1 Tax=Xanthomonas TaxID=338 RepID=UPI000E1F0D08|nr:MULTISPECIES: DUF4440 domain-containing protein [Xanthomonas]